MDIRQLEAFVCVVEQKSFSAAAKKLCLTQPTVSSHVNSLEKELNTRLIRRTTRLFEVTAEGERLYEYAASILRLQQKAVNEISDANKKELHLGASSVPGQCIVPEALARFHQAWPDLRIRLFHADSGEIIRRVADGRLDLGLVGTAGDAECDFIPFATDELVVAAPNTPRYRELMERNAPLEELIREPLIVREDHSGTKLETERFLKDLNVSWKDLNIVAHINDTEILRNCVVRGLGVSVVSRRMVEPSETRGELLVFPLGEHRLVRRLYIAVMKGGYLPKIAADFMRTLKEIS